MKIILGAGNTTQEGWISLQEAELDMTREADFLKYCEVSGVDAFLSEHVFEHLSYEDAIKAVENIYQFLKPGGCIRVGVPDGNFPNEEYKNVVKVGGPGPVDHPASSHKIVYDYKLLVELYESNGFVIHLLEYFDDDGKFHYVYWNQDDGRIGRSYRFDTRNYDNVIGFPSLIIDAFKP